MVVAVAGMSLGTVAWAATVGRQQAFGLAVDFRIFYDGAVALSRGHSPYAAAGFVSPPGLAALLLPVTRLPLWLAYGLFVLLSGSLSTAAMIGFARALSWRRGWLLAAIVLVSWLGLATLIWGQVDLLLVAGLLASMWMLVRDRPFLAGLAVGVFMLKPDVMWPAVIFLGLALWPDRRHLVRYGAGTVTTSALLLAAGFEWLPAWLHALVHFGAGIGVQPSLAGLPGLLNAAPTAWGLGRGFHSPVVWAIVGLGLVALATLGWSVVRSQRLRAMPQPERLIWAASFSMGTWLLVTPYAHGGILYLLPMLMMVVGKDGSGLGRPGPALTVLAVVALAPMWQLHLTPITLTPLSTALVLWAGIRGFQGCAPRLGPTALGADVDRVRLPLLDSTPAL
ncbi:MAG: glycosyltransferase family 87 protein [Candidatus Dormibacteria bacterium]